MARSTVIIPVFNQAALTRQCLESFLGREDCEVIVVNDASNDGTGRMLGRFGDRIKVVTHRKNSGFAKSCNDGAAVARTEYLVFLNNDTVPQPGWLEALVSYADEHPRTAVVGSKLLYPTNAVQHAGVVICQDRHPRHIYSGFPANHPAVNKSRRFQIVTAACLLVRREIFAATGGFDVKFRNGFEDVDFCLRLGATGHEIHYCAESVVRHFESASPGRFKHDKSNVALYRKRWFAHVQPDDLRYYAEDGLLNVSYDGTFPIHLSVSPELAVLNGNARKRATEGLLASRARQVAELTRETTRLRLEICRVAKNSTAFAYDKLRARVRATVSRVVPRKATVLVISKGDGALLELGGRDAQHFPQSATGGYAGFHPASGRAAVAALKKLRFSANHLVIPQTAFWWEKHYREFQRHLNRNATLVADEPDTCRIYRLHD